MKTAATLIRDPQALAHAILAGLITASAPCRWRPSLTGEGFLLEGEYPPQVGPPQLAPADGTGWSDPAPLASLVPAVRNPPPEGGLFPLRDAEAEAAEAGSMVFWMKREDLLPSIKISLALGNDRLQVSELEGGEAVLLKVDRPASYLLDWAQDRGAEVYVPAAGPAHGHVWVRRGWRHPLASVWAMHGADERTVCVFFGDGAGERRYCAPLTWASVYDVVDFSLPLRDAVAPPPSDRPVLEVPMRMIPGASPSDPEMVLLSGPEAELVLETFLRDQPEEAAQLSYCVLTVEGEPLYAVRPSGVKFLPEPLLKAGQPYARYRSLESLYLPVSQALEPPLRRDSYRKVFGLDGYNYCVLTARGQKLLIPRAGFNTSDGLREVLAFGGEAGAARVLAGVSWSLGPYAKAKPAARAPQPRSNKSGAEAPEQGAAPENNAARTRRKAAPPAPPKVKLESQSQQVAPAPAATGPGELEQQEALLERLVLKGGAPQDWVRLAQVKLRREKHLDAYQAAAEGLWEARYPASGGPPSREAARAEAELLGVMRDVMNLTKGQPSWLGALTSVLHSEAERQGAPPSTPQEVQTLLDSAAAYRQQSAQLGKKGLWLGWAAILRQTQDVRQQEEVREKVLKSLHSEGLAPADIVPFLRERLLKDPEVVLDEERSEEPDLLPDAQGLIRNLTTIEEHLALFQTAKIRGASQSSLARIYALSGMPTKAQEALNLALRTVAADWGQPDLKSTAEILGALPEVISRLTSKNSVEMWHSWVLLNAVMVTIRVDPALNPQAQRACDAAVSCMGSHYQGEFHRLRESLEKRIGKTDVVTFLTEGSRSFFSESKLPDEVNRMLVSLRRDRRAGEASEVEELIKHITKWASKELSQPSTSLEMVAKVTLETVAVLRKLKWERESAALATFEEFVRSLPPEPRVREASRLYFAVLHCAAARAMMDLGRERESMDITARLLGWLGREFIQILDLSDILQKEVLLTMEAAPRAHRAEVLRHLLGAVLNQERLEIGPDPSKPGRGFSSPFQAMEIIRMLDATLEAAVSNERLVLRRLREFEEREEGRIRYWVARDQPAAP